MLQKCLNQQESLKARHTFNSLGTLVWLYHSERIEQDGHKELIRNETLTGLCKHLLHRGMSRFYWPHESSLGFCTKAQHHVFHWVKTKLEYVLNTEKLLLALIYSVCQGFLNEDTLGAAVASDLWRWMSAPSTGGKRCSMNPKITTHIKRNNFFVFHCYIGSSYGDDDVSLAVILLFDTRKGTEVGPSS